MVKICGFNIFEFSENDLLIIGNRVFRIMIIIVLLLYIR